MTFDNLPLLWALVFLGVYLTGFAAARSALPSRRLRPVLAAACLALYCCGAGLAWLFYLYLGGEVMAFYGVLLLHAAAAALWLGRLFWQRRDRLHLPMPGLWAAYFLLLLFVTLFSRMDASLSRVIRMVPFENFLSAFAGNGFYGLTHWLLNLILFVPAGIALTRMGSRRLAQPSTALFFGFALSALIETLQLLLHLGVCDIDDLISNALGAGVGALLAGRLFPPRSGRR